MTQFPPAQWLIGIRFLRDRQGEAETWVYKRPDLPGPTQESVYQSFPARQGPLNSPQGGSTMMAGEKMRLPPRNELRRRKRRGINCRKHWKATQQTAGYLTRQTNKRTLSFAPSRFSLSHNNSLTRRARGEVGPGGTRGKAARRPLCAGLIVSAGSKATGLNLRVCLQSLDRREKVGNRGRFRADWRRIAGLFNENLTGVGPILPLLQRVHDSSNTLSASS
jgi:hypothetical protein